MRRLTYRDLTDAAVLGVAAGMRSFMPAGVLAARGRLGSSRVRLVVIALAAGELVGDKLPATPARTAPGPLAGRVGDGVFCGWRAAGPAGAATGAVAAAAATFGGYRARRALGARTGLPDPLLGGVEDLLAIALAVLGTRR